MKPLWEVITNKIKQSDENLREIMRIALSLYKELLQ